MFYAGWTIKTAKHTEEIPVEDFSCREIAAGGVTRNFLDIIANIPEYRNMSWEEGAALRIYLYEGIKDTTQVTVQVHVPDWDLICTHPLFREMLELLAKQYPTVTQEVVDDIPYGVFNPEVLPGIRATGNFDIVPYFYWLVLWCRIFRYPYDGKTSLRDILAQWEEEYLNTYDRTFVEGIEESATFMMATGTGPRDAFWTRHRYNFNYTFPNINAKDWI